MVQEIYVIDDKNDLVEMLERILNTTNIKKNPTISFFKYCGLPVNVSMNAANNAVMHDWTTAPLDTPTIKDKPIENVNRIYIVLDSHIFL